MRIPQTPPSIQNLIGKVGAGRFSVIVEKERSLWLQDRYLHWDELRRHPVPRGLRSHEEWWLLLKMGRMGRYRPVALNDKTGRPFLLSLPDLLIELLHNIDRGLGTPWNLPCAATDPNSRGEYLVGTLVQESIASSQLEGAVTTREVAKMMIRTGRSPRDKSELMILNNYRTMQRIMELRSEPLSPDLVLELHRRVSEGTLDDPATAGRLRKDDEKIRVMEGTVFHEPPPAGELPKRLIAMCDFANGRMPEYFVHPVVRAILLHFWLAYDHPFVDGNGRTARALFYWLMLHEKLELFEFVSISNIILRAPVQYATAFLHTETDDNDLTYFILHQAGVIRGAVEALHEYDARKTASLRNMEKRLHEIEGINYRQQALLAHALREPDTRYTIAGHARSHDVVHQTARTDLLGLVELGLLSAHKPNRTLVFRAIDGLEEKLAGFSRQAPAPSATQDRTLPLPLSPGPVDG